MKIRFQNDHGAGVWVSLMVHEPYLCGGSGGGEWMAHGWWRLEPRANVTTNVKTDNRYFYFYAEGDDGAVWNGPYGPIDCPYIAFNTCIGLLQREHDLRTRFPGSFGFYPEDRALGMVEVDAGRDHDSYSRYTVTLG